MKYESAINSNTVHIWRNKIRIYIALSNVIMFRMQLIEVPTTPTPDLGLDVYFGGLDVCRTSRNSGLNQ